jgi:hypothetical protein
LLVSPNARTQQYLTNEYFLAGLQQQLRATQAHCQEVTERIHNLEEECKTEHTERLVAQAQLSELETRLSIVWEDVQRMTIQPGEQTRAQPTALLRMVEGLGEEVAMFKRLLRRQQLVTLVR